MKEPPPAPPVDQRLNLGYVIHNQAYTERLGTATFNKESEKAHDHATSSLPPISEFPFEFRDAYANQCEVVANDFPEYRIPNFGIDEPGSFLREPASPSPSSTFADRNGRPRSRGHGNNDEVSQADVHRLEDRSCDAYPRPRPSYAYNTLQSPPSFDEQSHRAPMYPSPHITSSRAPVPQAQSQSSHYAPFGGVFRDPESACDYRKVATRFNRKPYRPPDGDPSIQALANDRQVQVKRIYDAMTRGDSAKDNTGSIAMRRWVHAAFYPSRLVEAFAHKVFDCLLQQAEDGFRGWHHNDYASDDRKGEPEDKNVSCAERLANIICGLEEEKTICEDVMTSACQIRMFVNAPRAYARRKEANRHGNSKRGKVTPSKADATGRGSKSRKLNSGRPSRSRQGTPSAPTPPDASHIFREIDPQFHNQLPQPPYYHTGQAQAQLASSPPINYLPPRPVPDMEYMDSRILTGSVPPQRSGLLSPPPPHANTPRFTPMPPQQQSRFMSPPLLSHDTTSVTPNGPSNSFNDALCSSWSPADNFGGASQCELRPVDVTFDPNFWDFCNASSPAPDAGNNKPFMGSVTHGLPVHEFVDPSELNIDPAFRTYWDSHPNVQPFPQTSLVENDAKEDQ